MKPHSSGGAADESDDTAGILELPILIVCPRYAIIHMSKQLKVVF